VTDTVYNCVSTIFRDRMQMKTTKSTTTILAVSQAAGLAARAVARLEANAAAIHEAATEKRGFQAVSSKEGFSALIRHGKTVIEISGDDFAVRQTD
jgi:hypothetical protein